MLKKVLLCTSLEKNKLKATTIAFRVENWKVNSEIVFKLCIRKLRNNTGQQNS